MINIDNSFNLLTNETPESNDMSEKKDIFLQSLFRIIYEIVLASHNTDNIQKYVNMQKDFLKKKKREIMIQNYNNKTDEIIDTLHPDMDHVHEEIKSMWLQEDRVISEIFKFLINNGDFTLETIIRNIINYNFDVDNNNILKFNKCGNYFSLLLKKGLIIPKNFKAIFTIWDFFEKLILSTNQDPRNRDLLFCYIYNNIFSKETLLYCVNHSESLNAFSKIVSRILSYNLITQDFCDKNRKNLLINFDDIVEYILSLIDNLSQYKISNTSMNSILEGIYNIICLSIYFKKEQKNDDDVYEYLFSILRELTLNNETLKESLLKSRNMLDYTLNECLFSNCKISKIKF